MKREWQPGDVAMSSYGRAFRTERGWRFDDASGDGDTQPAGLRPLVVIDPEDREQVEDLCRRYVEQYGGKWDSREKPVTDMQAALREFANPTPPKPEEPTGLGAVVEDANGTPWVRCENDDLEPHWYARNKQRAYADIDAVRVLSEGVFPS